MSLTCKIKSALIFALLLLSPGMLYSQAFHYPDQNKVAAIEKLWQTKGIGVVIKNWHGSSESKVKVANQFKKKYLGLILTDKKEFGSFFSDPAVSDKNLDAPVEWLNKKESFYLARLDAFEQTEYDSSYKEESTFVLAPPSPLTTSPGTTQCVNIGFENGNFTNWLTDTGYASGLPSPVCNSPYVPHIGTFDFSSRIQTYNSPLSFYDPVVGGTALPVVCPGGAWSAKLEDFQNGWGVSGIKKTFVVDGSKPWLVYKYAVLLQDPGDHADDDRPFFEVKITDPLGNSIPCAYYKVIAKPDPDIENFAQVEGTTFYWRDWTSVIVPLDQYIGTTLTIHFTVGDCALGGHLGYAYIDGDCLNGNLSVDHTCNPDKTITAPFGFDHYHWTGEEIEGDNFRNSVEVDEPGKYEVLLTTVTGCSVTREVTIATGCPEVSTNCTLSATHNVSSCDATSNTYNISGVITLSGITDGFLLVKAGAYSQIINGPFSGTALYNINGLPANGLSETIEFFVYKTRHFSSYTMSCDHIITFTAPTSCATTSFPCENCIVGFQPEPNKKYVVSAWVKQDGTTPLDYEYTDPFITVIFSDGSTTTQQTFTATGEIIDGWQRISAEFQIPNTTVNITIKLGTSSGHANFDDLRIYPADGTFKTFVYDPVTLRLVAELDENNYATFYEYDEEGALVRIKKETERGVMTIQENKNYKVKKQP